MLNESILDVPVKSLSPLVWQKTAIGSYVLNNDAKRKIRKLCEFLFSKKSIDWMNKVAGKKWHIEEYGIHIIGSITSNTYSDSSDIDLHFIIPTIPKKDAVLFSDTLRANYKKNYLTKNKTDCYIGNAKQHYPFELYYQPNSYIDMTSIGCYDVINNKWEVGPCIHDKNYNPYSKLFKKSYKYIDDVISDVRNIILQPYELSKVISNVKNTDILYDYLANQIICLLKKSWDISVIVWNKRNFNADQPNSKSDAAAIRKSKTKLMHDAAFKFLEKFGYISILRDYANLWQAVKKQEIDIVEVKNKILNSVNNYLKADTTIVKESIITESTIDFPHDTLCQNIWNKSNGVWELKPDVYDKLLNVINKVSKLSKIPVDNFIVYFVGSNTSNSYTQNADIDLHFQLKDSCKLNIDSKALQNEFKEIEQKLFKYYLDDMIIGGFPVELYFQPNKFQDMMSIGCYDILNKKWEVGPELTPIDFDPYSAYYDDIKKRSAQYSVEIRNKILGIYEKAIDASNMDVNSKVFSNCMSQLLLLIYTGIKLIANIKHTRNVFNAPTSKEEALKFRNSRKWKIADSTIKLIDKYGYSWIFKQLETSLNDIGFENIDLIKEMLPMTIVKIIKFGISNSDKLAE